MKGTLVLLLFDEGFIKILVTSWYCICAFVKYSSWPSPVSCFSISYPPLLSYCLCESCWVAVSYIFISRTSMSSPFVAGAISLLLSLENGHDLNSIKERLYRTGKKSRHYRKKLISEKRIDVYEFIKGK